MLGVGLRVVLGPQLNPQSKALLRPARKQFLVRGRVSGQVHATSGTYGESDDDHTGACACHAACTKQEATSAAQWCVLI